MDEGKLQRDRSQRDLSTWAPETPYRWSQSIWTSSSEEVLGTSGAEVLGGMFSVPSLETAWQKLMLEMPIMIACRTSGV